MSSRRQRQLVVLAVLAVGVVVVRATLLRPDPVPVTVYRVVQGKVEESVTNSKAGTVKTRRRASLSPEIGGRVEKLPVRKGDRVGKGQLLMRLANADYQAQVRREQRALETARAGEREACERAAQAERDLARSTMLARDRLVSQELEERARNQRDTGVSACEAARAQVQQSQATLDFARVSLAKTELRAPFAGVIAELKCEVGEWISPSPPALPIPPVLELLDPDAIYVSAPLDEVDAGKVRVGQMARVTLEAFRGRGIAGHVSRVAPYVLDVQQQSRTFEIEVDLEDAAFAHTLLPGSSADVEVILAARDGALRIPSYALIEGNKVLVFREAKLVSLPVEIGLKSWEFVEVKRGLAPGDAVVVSLDRADVKDGAAARLTAETTK